MKSKIIFATLVGILLSGCSLTGPVDNNVGAKPTPTVMTSVQADKTEVDLDKDVRQMESELKQIDISLNDQQISF